MASYLNETESIVEISRSLCFLDDRAISIAAKESSKATLHKTIVN